MIKKPPFRKLRGYAFDPSLSLNIDTALINMITYKVPWEDELGEGPVGEYLEVIDFDPTVQKWYKPVNLNELFIVAQEGIEPSGSNPQFHQQMVYAVAMTTIKNFESALGRAVLWSPRRLKKNAEPEQKKSKGKKDIPPQTVSSKTTDEYIPRLRIYPHALREANAYYSPQKKALLFGYFSSRPADLTLQMPNSLTFTCLSHDIIAHETTHAILDGLYRRYTDDTNPDVLAFHEAFADIVALFQHFTFADVLKNQIAATKGDLKSQNLLGKLAQEFGIAIGNYGALRDAIGDYNRKTNQWKPKEPTGEEYRTVTEPHARGAILVSAVFDAFLTIYKSRVSDLLRIASNGTGILPQGELQADLVNRLATEAAKTAGHVLRMCVRALDFCPPVDITFGDFLRAIITADSDLIADDSRDYRIAFIDAFRRRGIYPTGVKNLSVESLVYTTPKTAGLQEQLKIITDFLRDFRRDLTYVKKREEIFELKRAYIAGRYPDKKKAKAANADPEKSKQETGNESPNELPPTIYGLHRRLHVKFRDSLPFEMLTGLLFSGQGNELGIAASNPYNNNQFRPSFEVHSLHHASRVGPDGNQNNQVIVTLIQYASVKVVKGDDGEYSVRDVKPRAEDAISMTGGCTLIFDLDTLELKYAISKPLLDTSLLETGAHQLNSTRAIQLKKHLGAELQNTGIYKAYFGMKGQQGLGEPFSLLHTH